MDTHIQIPFDPLYHPPSLPLLVIGMEDMATKYSIAGSEGRVVDYLLCFKTYLLDAAEKYVPSETVMIAGTEDGLGLYSHPKLIVHTY